MQKTIAEIKSVLKAIHVESEYREYLKIIDLLVDCDEGSPEEELLELISLLVEDYESRHFVFETSN